MELIIHPSCGTLRLGIGTGKVMQPPRSVCKTRFRQTLSSRLLNPTVRNQVTQPALQTETNRLLNPIVGELGSDKVTQPAIQTETKRLLNPTAANWSEMRLRNLKFKLKLRGCWTRLQRIGRRWGYATSDSNWIDEMLAARWILPGCIPIPDSRFRMDFKFKYYAGMQMSSRLT